MFKFVQNLTIFLQSHGFDDSDLWILGLFTFIIIGAYQLFWRNLLQCICHIVERYDRKSHAKFWLEIVNKIRLEFIIFNAIYAAILVMPMPLIIKTFFTWIFILITTIFMIDVIRTFAIHSVKLYLYTRSKATEEAISTVTNFTSVISTVILWLIAGVIFLIVMDIDIQGLLGGLGIASAVVAFASQNFLKDIFAFFTIYVDRSFAVGDYITFDKFEGNIKEIRLRTTRIKALLGNELIVPNNQLTSSVIQNYNRLQRRRISFTFKTKVVPADLLERAIQEIKDQFASGMFGERVTLNSVALSELSDYGLEVKIIYRFAYLPGHSNFYEHLDLKSQVQLMIMRVLSKYHISLIQLEHTAVIE